MIKYRIRLYGFDFAVWRPLYIIQIKEKKSSGRCWYYKWNILDYIYNIDDWHGRREYLKPMFKEEAKETVKRLNNRYNNI